MTLATRDVAALDGLMDKIEQGKSNEEIAAYYGLKHAAQVSSALSVLRRIGVDVPDRKRGGALVSRQEMADFREWQRQRELERKPELLRSQANGVLARVHA